jgi:hypothetical protein
MPQDKNRQVLLVFFWTLLVVVVEEMASYALLHMYLAHVAGLLIVASSNAP